MLVLSRKKGESIKLYLPNGEAILVMVVSTNDRKARIGLTAPASVDIVRSELEVCYGKEGGYCERGDPFNA